ncbi:MAG TPA: HTTM domain-containing protein [Pseudacidobacterium sp.]|nr:HTTM domain-containing protein [Pseudacidobacterium sp.]
MILKDFRKALEDFFFTPQSPTPIGLFRIFYGLCVLATVLLLRSDWLAWFGVHGWVSLSTMTTIEPGIRLNLFTILPQDDRWISALFWFFLVFAVLLTVGLWTRLSSIAVFLCLASIQQRNLFIIHGGDAFLRVTGFFLMFAPAGAAFSLDRLIRIRRGKEGAEIAPKAPWAQRMIQFQLALLYFISFWWKMKGHAWLDGTALYYVAHLHEMQRFPIPRWIQNPVISKLGGWYTLALEFSLGTLIWFKRFRYPLLLLGVLFHLGIEYAINAPMFEWDILAAYVLFIEPADLERWLKSMRPAFLRLQH